MKTKLITVKPAERYEDSVGYILDAHKKIASTADHGFPPKEVERIQKITNEMISDSQKAFEKMRKMHETIVKGIEAFVKIVSLIGDPIFESLKRASEKGWYISPNIIDRYFMDELRDMLEEDSLESFEKRIIKDSKEKIPEVLKNCSKTFPNRRHIFQELQNLYKRKQYHSLIALAYAQADGISNEIWGHGFFDKDEVEKDLYELKVYRKYKDLDVGVASIIKNQLGININEITQYSGHVDFKEPEKRFSSFNRHLVIHGHSTNYGSQINAIRAIYLLDFIEYFHTDEDANSILD